MAINSVWRVFGEPNDIRQLYIIEPFLYLICMILIIARKRIDDPCHRGGTAAVMRHAMLRGQFPGGQGANELLEFFHRGPEFGKKFRF